MNGEDESAMKLLITHSLGFPVVRRSRCCAQDKHFSSQQYSMLSQFLPFSSVPGQRWLQSSCLTRSQGISFLLYTRIEQNSPTDDISQRLNCDCQTGTLLYKLVQLEVLSLSFILTFYLPVEAHAVGSWVGTKCSGFFLKGLHRLCTSEAL